MSLNVIEIPRYLRRQLERIVHKSRDRDHVCRALAMLHLYDTGGCVAEAARRGCAAMDPGGWLKRLAYVWRRARRTLHLRDWSHVYSLS